MDNQDIFNKIKTAAENAATKDFQSMEKIWSRIDAKLDTKVEKKNNNNWKKLLVAASVLLIATIGYQFFKSEKEISLPNNQIVTKTVEKPITNDSLENQNALFSIKNPKIKENADKILDAQTSNSNVVASAEVVVENAAEINEVAKLLGADRNNIASSNSNSSWLVDRNFNSRGVYHDEAQKMNTMEEEANKQQTKKLEPLIIADGLVSKKSISEFDKDTIDSIVELTNPIYYINSILYTEEELFGPNPTSPYSPLNKQNIESTTVLSPEKAVKIYGERGKNGVVLITTKDGKPISKKD